ncbi:uncharacterized protein LOC144291088 [Canis aureus]
MRSARREEARAREQHLAGPGRERRPPAPGAPVGKGAAPGPGARDDCPAPAPRFRGRAAQRRGTDSAVPPSFETRKWLSSSPSPNLGVTVEIGNSAPAPQEPSAKKDMKLNCHLCQERKPLADAPRIGECS